MLHMTKTCSSPTIDHPFDDRAPGDCILRSSDGVSHKVFRIILSMASPIFKSMFDLPQSTTPTVSEIPVIDVAETSATLLNLLLLLHPATVVNIPTYDQAVELIEAYDKYNIRIDSLHPFLSDVLLSKDGVEKDPLGVYAVTWRLGLKEAAQNASRYLHLVDLTDEVVKRDLLSRSGDIGAILALWDLRYRRERALDGVIDAVQSCARGRLRTPDHSNIRRLRDNARTAFNTPHPVCRDLQQFFGADVILDPQTCHYCRQTPAASTIEQNSVCDAMVAAFPQVIDWNKK